jgi:hypothetical protein
MTDNYHTEDKHREKMMNAAEYLKTELNIDITNRVYAVQDAGATEFDADTYRRIIGELSGSDDINVGDDEAKTAFMYMVDNIATGLPGNIAYPIAEAKAVKFVEANPWINAKPDFESTYTPKSTVDAVGNPKQKKGAKKAQAIAFWKANQGKFTTRKDWIEALMEAVSLSKGAASTYHYNMKSGVWA